MTCTQTIAKRVEARERVTCLQSQLQTISALAIAIQTMTE